MKSGADEIRDQLRDQLPDEPLARVLLERGEEFNPRPLPNKAWRRRAGSKGASGLACLINAQRAALTHDDWAYVEGYAIRRDDPEGIQFHCWNLDRDGRLIDTTWDDDGAAYLGVVVDKTQMARLAVERNSYFKVVGYESVGVDGPTYS